MIVCVRACVRVCVCVCARARVRAQAGASAALASELERITRLFRDGLLTQDEFELLAAAKANNPKR